MPYHYQTGMPVPSMDQPWYSFDFGPIHFLQYSTGEQLPSHAAGGRSQAARCGGLHRRGLLPPLHCVR